MKRIIATALLLCSIATWASEVETAVLAQKEHNTLTVTFTVTCNDTTTPEWAGVKAATNSIIEKMQNQQIDLFMQQCHDELMTIEALAKNTDAMHGEINIATSSK